MKKSKLAVLFAILVSVAGCFTGCRTTDGTFDPVTTAQVRESVKPIVATAVRVWLASEPNPEYRNAAVAFSEVICEMRDAKEFSSAILANRLSTELDKRNLLRDIWAATAKDVIVSQFNIWIIRRPLSDEAYAWNLLDILCDGIKSGAGVPPVA